MLGVQKDRDGYWGVTFRQRLLDREWNLYQTRTGALAAVRAIKRAGLSRHPWDYIR